ncbi:hypothetical protein ACF0H5_013034 [Mactra antiquata]
MEERSLKSQSSVDIRQSNEDPITNQAASSRRRRFFSSFRKKFRSGKYKDKNYNIESFSVSQPNIYRPVYRNSNISTDEDSPSQYPSSPDYTQITLDKSLSDPDVTPEKEKSKSPRKQIESEHVALVRMSSEEKDAEEVEVIETYPNTQVPLTFIACFCLHKFCTLSALKLIDYSVDTLGLYS